MRRVLFPLVARAGALAEVDAVLTAARAGRGALVTVTGEPGIGKTRLAEAVADLAGAGRPRPGAGHAVTGRAADFEVIWTWCPTPRARAPSCLSTWPRSSRQAAEYARRAGDRAMAALAFEDAARWYEHVADVLRLRPRPAGPLDRVKAGLTPCGPISRHRGNSCPGDGRKINVPNE